MLLRNHPLMTRKSGYKNWPPKWTTTHLDVMDKPTGEIGTLEQVFMHRLLENKIYLLIRYEGVQYMGAMHFDYPKFCDELFALLKSHLGHPIKEIAALDLSYTL